MGCNHNCASCGGCAATLELTEAEIGMLEVFSQIPFLPVARRADDYVPVYLEGGEREQLSLVLQCLQKKGLISLDFDKPLKGFDMSAYKAWPVHGSMALTERGQTVVELLGIQGIG